MIARVRPIKHDEPVLGDDMLWGADEIGRYLKLPRRRVYTLIESHGMPVIRLSMKRIAARKSDLNSWLSVTKDEARG